MSDYSIPAGLLDYHKIQEYLRGIGASEEVLNTAGGFKGELTDIAHYMDGGKIVRSEVLQVDHNVIVSDFSKVIAGMLSGTQHTAPQQSLVLAVQGTWYSFNHPNLVGGTVVVKVGASTKNEYADYDIDYTGGRIRSRAGGTIAAGNTVTLDYKYTQSLYWAIGSGNAGWDPLPDPTVNESAATTSLVSETFRKIIPSTAMKFIDGANNVVAGPTNRVQIDLTFIETEANGPWRELAIVGYNAGRNANTGLLVNHKIHKIITKDNNIQIQRILRFTF